MSKIKISLARALTAYLTLLPLVGAVAEAQLQPRPIGPPGPIGPPVPSPGPGPGSPSVFTALDKSLAVKALNGFETEATPGYFSHNGHSHDGGLIRVESPWGETLAIRYWLTPHGVTFEYDEDLKVRYYFDADGTLDEIVAESPLRQARMAVGNRAQLAARGELDFTSFDLSAYEVIEESLRDKHSQAFLDGLGQAQEGAIEAGCATSIILCAACIVAWANTIPAIAAACIVGGVPTFGGACFFAILAHEAAGFACAATCVDMVLECRGRPHGDPIPDGCEP